MQLWCRENPFFVFAIVAITVLGLVSVLEAYSPNGSEQANKLLREQNKLLEQTLTELKKQNNR